MKAEMEATSEIIRFSRRREATRCLLSHGHLFPLITGNYFSFNLSFVLTKKVYYIIFHYVLVWFLNFLDLSISCRGLVVLLHGLNEHRFEYIYVSSYASFALYIVFFLLEERKLNISFFFKIFAVEGIMILQSS